MFKIWNPKASAWCGCLKEAGKVDNVSKTIHFGYPVVRFRRSVFVYFVFMWFLLLLFGWKRLNYFWNILAVSWWWEEFRLASWDWRNTLHINECRISSIKSFREHTSNLGPILHYNEILLDWFQGDVQGLCLWGDAGNFLDTKQMEQMVDSWNLYWPKTATYQHQILSVFKSTIEKAAIEVGHVW